METDHDLRLVGFDGDDDAISYNVTAWSALVGTLGGLEMLAESEAPRTPMYEHRTPEDVREWCHRFVDEIIEGKHPRIEALLLEHDSKAFPVAQDLILELEGHPPWKPKTGWAIIVHQALWYRWRGSNLTVQIQPYGIPVHKLGSNDGWWVTGPECRAAIATYDAITPNALHDNDTVLREAGRDPWYPNPRNPDLRERFLKFMEFLRRGALHRGFTVY